MTSITHIVTTYNWLIKIALILLIGSIVSLIELIIYRRLLPLCVRKNRIWLQSLLRTLHHPLQLYIWIIVISFIIVTISRLFAFDGEFIQAMAWIRRLLTIVFVFWFGMRFIRNFENAAVNRAKAGISRINDETSVHAMAQLSRIALIVIILLMLLQTGGVRLSALLTLGGVGGAIIGFAAKDSLANFIGGMMIYWDRPFSVGDWIRSPDREIEGTVENIGWRLTRIRTFDTRPLYVPNGILSNISVENPSRMMNRRIKFTLGIRYRDANQVIALSKAIEDFLRKRVDIDQTKTLFVNFTDFASCSLNILIYAFTKTTDQLKFQAVLQDVLLKVLTLVSDHGAECAFSTQTLNIPESVLVTLKKEQLHEQ